MIKTIYSTLTKKKTTAYNNPLFFLLGRKNVHNKLQVKILSKFYLCAINQEFLLNNNRGTLLVYVGICCFQMIGKIPLNLFANKLAFILK